MLSDTAQINIQQALDLYRHWQTPTALNSKPVFEKYLSGGRSNISALVAAPTGKFVVRLDNINPRRLGLNRPAEWHIQKKAAERDLAPCPVYCNLGLGILVSEYIQAKPAVADDTGELEQIANLLRGIHALPTVKYRLLPLDRAYLYQSLLHQPTLPEDFIALSQQLADTSEPCLCHNDLLRSNRIPGQSHLLAIDWEYAATGDPWFDLAVVCDGDALEDAQRQLFLFHYLGHSPTHEQNQRLDNYRRVYRVLSEMWERVTVP